MPAPRPVSERFWEKVRKTNTCWLWIGSIANHGYGQISYKLKPVVAHRISFELHYGAIPKGMWVLHRCDNKACVNPDHLFLGTNFDNVQDMIRKGRSWSQKDRAAVVRLGHKCRKYLPHIYGVKQHSAKLTPAKVRKIRTLCAAGLSFTAIGKKFGVARTSIAAIYRGKNWKQVK